jgi:nucleotide-binding universal stress UspA family protein
MKILLPVDGSSCALQAVAHAVQLAQGGLQAGFVLVNVQEPASLYEVVVVHDVAGIAALREAAGADLLAPAEAVLAAAGLSFESEVAGGDPHHELLDIAERYGCTAILLGAQGQGAGGAHRLGSVALAVLSHSTLPVTVVHAAEAPRARRSHPGAAAQAGFSAAQTDRDLGAYGGWRRTPGLGRHAASPARPRRKAAP